MKNNLRTFTLCVKVQSCEEAGSYLQIFVGLYWTGPRNEKTNCKKNETKKKERKKMEKKLQRR